MFRGQLHKNIQPQTFEHIEGTLQQKCQQLLAVLDEVTITPSGENFWPIYLGCAKPYPARENLNKLLDEIRQLSSPFV